MFQCILLLRLLFFALGLFRVCYLTLDIETDRYNIPPIRMNDRLCVCCAFNRFES